MQRNILSFKGQNIYVGIDVHLKTWHVTIVTATEIHVQSERAISLYW